jgi:hypothetical protein
LDLAAHPGIFYDGAAMTMEFLRLRHAADLMPARPAPVAIAITIPLAIAIPVAITIMALVVSAAIIVIGDDKRLGLRGADARSDGSDCERGC